VKTIEFQELDMRGCGDVTCKACGAKARAMQADSAEVAAAERARNAYFGAGRHGYVSFTKLPSESQQAWRNVVRAVLAPE